MSFIAVGGHWRPDGGVHQLPGGPVRFRWSQWERHRNVRCFSSRCSPNWDAGISFVSHIGVTPAIALLNLVVCRDILRLTPDYYFIQSGCRPFCFLSCLAFRFKFVPCYHRETCRGEVKNKLNTARNSCCRMHTHIYTYYHDGVVQVGVTPGTATRDLFKHCSLSFRVSNQSAQCWGCTFIFLSTDMELSISIEKVITCLSNTALYYLFTVPKGNSCGFQKTCVSTGLCDAICQPVACLYCAHIQYIFAQMSVDRFTTVQKKWGWQDFLIFFERSVSCWSRLHLFD